MKPQPKLVTRLGRWVARHLNVKYQAIITFIYVMVAVVGPGKTLVVIMALIKEMKAHQEHHAKTRVRRQRSVSTSTTTTVQPTNKSNGERVS